MCFSALIFFAWHLYNGNQKELDAELRTYADAIATRVGDLVNSRVPSLRRMADRRAHRPQMTRDEWVHDVANHFVDQPGYQAIEYVDPEFRVTWVYPVEGNERAVGFDLGFEEHRRRALMRSRDTRQVVVSQTTDLIQGGRGFLVFAPIFSNEASTQFGGFIVAVFRVETLLAEILQSAPEGLEFAVFEEDAELVRLGAAPSDALAVHVQEVDVPIESLRWRVRVWPSVHSMAERRSPFVLATLGGGILLLALTAILTRLVLLATRRSQFAEKLAAELATERDDIRTVLNELPLGVGYYRNERLTLWNNGFESIHAAMHGLVHTGAAFKDIVHAVAERHAKSDDANVESDLRLRLAESSSSENTYFLTAPNGHFFQLNETRTKDGGIIESYVDVNELREREHNLKTLNQNLESALRRLEESNSQLERFAYVASHDLQEPLRMVASYTQLLERKYAAKLGSDGQQYIQFACEGALRMQRLIADLLNYSRINAAEPKMRTVDMNAVVATVLTALHKLIEDRNARVQVEPLPPVLGNVRMLEQLLQNLFGNALKFNLESVPHIRLSGQRAEHDTHFIMEDNGIGFDARHAKLVFEPFKRLHGRNEFSGSGIGLTLCHSIVRKHGGSISIAPRSSGGARVSFSLPTPVADSKSSKSQHTGQHVDARASVDEAGEVLS